MFMSTNKRVGPKLTIIMEGNVEGSRKRVRWKTNPAIKMT